MRASRSRRVIDGRIAEANTAEGSTLCSAPMRDRMRRVNASTSLRDCGSQPLTGIGRPERDEHARPVAHGVAHHFGELARERALELLDALLGQDVILEHEVVGDGDGNDDEIRLVGGERGVDQAGLRRFQLAAVAAAAFG